MRTPKDEQVGLSVLLGILVILGLYAIGLKVMNKTTSAHTVQGR